MAEGEIARNLGGKKEQKFPANLKGKFDVTRSRCTRENRHGKIQKGNVNGYELRLGLVRSAKRRVRGRDRGRRWADPGMKEGVNRSTLVVER